MRWAMGEGWQALWLASTELRDEVAHLALHAGCSAHFSRDAKSGLWSLSLTTASQFTEPHLAQENVKSYMYEGITRCVTMPHGLILTRRATRNAEGIVIRASRPVWTGQCIPSRMTIGQLKETLLGKVLVELGLFGDGTNFTHLDIKDIAKELQNLGYERYGNDVLYNGLTGEATGDEHFHGAGLLSAAQAYDKRQATQSVDWSDGEFDAATGRGSIARRRLPCGGNGARRDAGTWYVAVQS